MTETPTERRKAPLAHDPEKLRAALEKSRLSGAELARRVGVSRSVVSEMLKGTRGCSTDVLDAIAKELSVPRGRLLSKEPGAVIRRRRQP